jgi:hypothetical protein
MLSICVRNFLNCFLFDFLNILFQGSLRRYKIGDVLSSLLSLGLFVTRGWFRQDFLILLEGCKIHQYFFVLILHFAFKLILQNLDLAPKKSYLILQIVISCDNLLRRACKLREELLDFEAPWKIEVFLDFIFELANLSKKLVNVLRFVCNELVLHYKNIVKCSFDEIFNLSFFCSYSRHIVELEKVLFFLNELLNTECGFLFSLCFSDL